MTRILKSDDIRLRTGILEYHNGFFENITYNDTKFYGKTIKIHYGYTYEDIEPLIVNMEFGSGREYFKLTDDEVMEHIILETI